MRWQPVPEGPVTELTVKVWDEPHLIRVYRKTKSFWMAVGDYRSKRIEITARSAASAAEHWSRAACYEDGVGRKTPKSPDQ